MSDLASIIEAETGPKVLRFSERILPGNRKGWITTTSPEAMRALNAMWNNRQAIANALRAYK